MIQAYFDQIRSVVDRYSFASFVSNTELAFETRSGGQAYIKGRIFFTDDSELHFREYLDLTGKRIDKLMYSYHYQDAMKQLIFRYDNANHQPALPLIEHKHIRNEIVVSLSPDLEDVLIEVYDTLNT